MTKNAIVDAAVVSAHGRSMNILMIDDSEEDFLLVRHALATDGGVASVQRAHSVDEGLEALEHDGYDVCLLKHRLDGRDGLDVLTLVSEREIRTPIIVLSGVGNADVEARAMALGATDYLDKTELSGRSLSRALRHAVERSRVLAALRERDRQQGLSETRLVAADRLAAVGLLAAGIAHEINGPLTAVLCNLESVLAHDDETSDADVGEALEHSRIAIRRILDIVRDIKLFARPIVDAKESVNVGFILDAAVRMASGQIAHRARIVREYDGVPNVVASASRLEQVFLNLIINAAQALPPTDSGGIIRLRISAGRPDEVVIEVKDTGCGIPPEQLLRVFEPFFTTKPEGTGLGLALTQRMVADLGGELTVESSVGQGSTFRVVLRACEVPAPQQATARPLLPPALVRARILVVDDESFIGTAVLRALRKEHDVESVTSGADALALFEHGARFDLVLSDMYMPIMSGMEFHDRVASKYPDVAHHLAFFTGGAFTPLAAAFLATRQDVTFEKPFRNADLRAFVNHFIARSRLDHAHVVMPHRAIDFATGRTPRDH